MMSLEFCNFNYYKELEIIDEILSMCVWTLCVRYGIFPMPTRMSLIREV
jgi:hypothetical protein